MTSSAWFDGFLPSFPTTVTWEVTYRCNLRCVHCYSESGPPREEIPIEKCKEILDQLGEARVFKILFGGGEPFTRPDFLQLLEYARKATVATLVVCTNGYYITPSSAQRVKDIGARVQVSVDGGTEPTHDFFRGKGSFQQAMMATSTLKKAAVPVSWSISLWSQAVQEVGQVLDLARKLGVFRCTFRHVFPVGRASLGYSELMLKPDKWPDVKQKLTEYKDTYKDSLEVEFESIMDQLLGSVQTANASPAGVQHCVITPEGYILPCQYLRNSKFVIGNLWLQSFGGIWKTSPVLAAFREPSNPWFCKDCMSNCMK